MSKKLFTLVMSLVLVVGLMPLPAFGASAEQAAGDSLKAASPSFSITSDDDDYDDAWDDGDDLWDDEDDAWDDENDPLDEDDDDSWDEGYDDADGWDDDLDDEGDEDDEFDDDGDEEYDEEDPGYGPDEELDDLAYADIDGVKDFVYNGKAQLQKNMIVSFDGIDLVEDEDYYVYYADERGNEIDASQVRDAGDYRVVVVGIEDAGYEGELYEEFEIDEAPNTLKASAKAKKVTLKAKSLKKKSATVKNITASKAIGKVSYKNVSKKKAGKFTINKKGALTVPKKTAKGKYNMTVKVTAAGDANHDSLTRSVSFVILVS